MSLPVWLGRDDDHWTVSVLAQPKASRTGVAGIHDGHLKLRVQAPPVDGRANDAIQAWLADALGVARRDVRLLRGASSRRKVFAVSADVPLEALLGLCLEGGGQA
ncbi:MAG: DUF167 domain-containing protein [Burkholderiaceae bacterium]